MILGLLSSKHSRTQKTNKAEQIHPSLSQHSWKGNKQMNISQLQNQENWKTLYYLNIWSIFRYSFFFSVKESTFSQQRSFLPFILGSDSVRINAITSLVLHMVNCFVIHLFMARLTPVLHKDMANTWPSTHPYAHLSIKIALCIQAGK